MSVLRIAFVAAAVLIGTAAFAWADEQSVLAQNCDGGTYEMVDCINAKTAILDQRLIAAYSQALKDVEPRQRALLRAAQRAWIKFRDAQCDYIGAEAGSIARIDYVECLRRMTEQRARELETQN